jgi:cytidyltransferase-like protein
MTIVLCSGGFDPIHSGHIEYLRIAATLGDILVVAVNSDEWLKRKKGNFFMPFNERAEIVRNLRHVDFVIGFDDSDNTAKHAITMVRQSYPSDTIVFANGGDRTNTNIPELSYEDNNLEFAFGVGGDDKKNSSSWILDNWKAPKVYRSWGFYRVMYEQPGTKVKELIVEPGLSLSRQRHYKRSEYWHVVSGEGYLELDDESLKLFPHDSIHIGVRQWHKLFNHGKEPLKIVEIQYGIECIEEDIERESAFC